MADQSANYTRLLIACAAGRLNSVRELLKLDISFTNESGSVGLGPLHIAAAHGHLDIVKELLEVPEDLCTMKGPDDRIPLHYAIENGNLKIMKELLHDQRKTIEATTSQKETALHLAVRNNQFHAVVELFKHLRESSMAGVINAKDNEGNTALHLAAAAKNFKVVDFMLHQHALRHVVVDVNAKNNEGWTPLDFSQRGVKGRKIRKILNRAGAKRGEGCCSSLALEDELNEGESRANIRNALLVVAGLIANATYQSVLQAPHFKTEVDKTYTKGFLALYASLMTGWFGRDLAYIVFITGNTFGLLVSVQMMISLTKDLSVKLPMLLSMTLMVQTYYSHTYYLPFTTLEKEFSLKNVELLSVLPLTIPIFLLLIQRPLAEALEFYLDELSLFDHLRDMYDILT